jgi:hypothetical protein
VFLAIPESACEAPDRFGRCIKGGLFSGAASSTVKISSQCINKNRNGQNVDNGNQHHCQHAAFGVANVKVGWPSQ